MFSGGQITPQHVVLRTDSHRLMDGLQFRGVGDGISVHEGVSVAGFKQPAQHGDGGGFAGAVGALWYGKKRQKETRSVVLEEAVPWSETTGLVKN